MSPKRIAIVASHPIQYQAPWFKHLATELEVHVFYCHRQDAGGQSRAGFGVEFEWDLDLLEGYDHSWLQNVSRNPGLDRFGGCDTPDVGRELKSGQFDAVIVMGWNRKSFVQAIRGSWASSLPVFLRGDPQLRTPRRSSVRLAKYLPYRAMLPLVAGHLYVGTRNREYLEHYGVPDSKLFFAPHCVDNASFASAAEAALTSGASREFRSGLGIRDDDHVVTFVGKLIPKKRPADLIRAVVELEALEGSSAPHAVIVGDGPLRDECEARAANSSRVHLVGFRNQSELPTVYAASQTICLPSDGRETWGLVANEAMACGVPAIVSDSAGCAPDLIDEGLTGATFGEGDVDALAETIRGVRRVLGSDPDQVARALEKKMREFSFDGATRGVHRALESVRSPVDAPVAASA